MVRLASRIFTVILLMLVGLTTGSVVHAAVKPNEKPSIVENKSSEENLVTQQETETSSLSKASGNDILLSSKKELKTDPKEEVDRAKSPANEEQASLSEINSVSSVNEINTSAVQHKMPISSSEYIVLENYTTPAALDIVAKQDIRLATDSKLYYQANSSIIENRDSATLKYYSNPITQPSKAEDGQSSHKEPRPFSDMIIHLSGLLVFGSIGLLNDAGNNLQSYREIAWSYPSFLLAILSTILTVLVVISLLGIVNYRRSNRYRGSPFDYLASNHLGELFRINFIRRAML